MCVHGYNYYVTYHTSSTYTKFYVQCNYTLLSLLSVPITDDLLQIVVLFHFYVITGACYRHGGRPPRESHHSDPDSYLVCNADGTYDVSQGDFNGNQWCVFPNNGSEIPNTRTKRHQLPADCDDIGESIVSVNSCYSAIAILWYKIRKSGKK